MTTIREIVEAEGILLAMSGIITPFGYVTAVLIDVYQFSLDLAQLGQQLVILVITIWITFHLFGLIVYVTMHDTVEAYR